MSGFNTKLGYPPLQFTFLYNYIDIIIFIIQEGATMDMLYVDIMTGEIFS